HEDDRAGGGVQQLPRRGAPARVVTGDPADRPEPEGDRAGGRGDQHPVEPPGEPDDPDVVVERPVAEPARARVDGFDRHQSLRGAGVTPCFWKYASKTWSAAGAAALPPWPPFSITAHTTMDGLSVGP